MLDKADIEKIERIHKDFMLVHEKYNSLGSKPYEIFTKFVSESMKDGVISRMHKELIAVGIAAFHNCEPCTSWHVREAMQHGATEEQIAEAVMVAAEMGGGPVLARCGFAFKVVEYLKGQKK